MCFCRAPPTNRAARPPHPPCASRRRRSRFSNTVGPSTATPTNPTCVPTAPGPATPTSPRDNDARVIAELDLAAGPVELNPRPPGRGHVVPLRGPGQLPLAAPVGAQNHFVRVRDYGVPRARRRRGGLHRPVSER